MFLMLFLKSMKSIFPNVSVANFEHYFFWVSTCGQSYITATYCLTEMSLDLKLLLGFLAEPIRTRVNDIQVK